MANIGTGLPYIIGTRLDGSVEEGDLFSYPMTNAKISTNTPVLFSGGNVQANTTTLAATFAGITAETVDNSAGTAGSQVIKVIKPNPQKAFWIPVSGSTAITASAVGTLCDFDSTGLKINLSANSPTAYGMQVIDVDFSTLALAANAGGFAKVRFIAASE